MKPLSPKDASILALVAENPGMSLAQMTRLAGLADDPDEVLAVAKELLGQSPDGSVATPQKASADAFREWVRGNRRLQPA